MASKTRSQWMELMHLHSWSQEADWEIGTSADWIKVGTSSILVRYWGYRNFQYRETLGYYYNSSESCERREGSCTCQYIRRDWYTPGHRRWQHGIEIYHMVDSGNKNPLHLSKQTERPFGSQNVPLTTNSHCPDRCRARNMGKMPVQDIIFWSPYRIGMENRLLLVVTQASLPMTKTPSN